MSKPNFSKIALLLLLSSSTSDAFFSPPTTGNQNKHWNDFCSASTSTTLSAAALPSPEESAKALTEYMVKAHEDKLKLLKQVEEKKNLELKALQEELLALKASRGTSNIELSSSKTDSTPTSASVEELQAKLVSYQKFMADYIVKSSEEKFNAVKEAEKAAASKYEAKLLLLGGSAAGAAPSSPTKEKPNSPNQKKSNVNEAFAKRTAKLTDAAEKGKNSRWGDAEVQNAQKIVSGGISTAASAPTPAAETATVESVIDVEIPAEVVEADHGLRADGGVGGLTLAERVMMGSKASANPAETVTPPASKKETSLFEKRNARVLEAANAGLNTRWGEPEVKQVLAYESQRKALNGASQPAPVNGKKVDVSEADKGLRSSGGVGGPSLSERVNLGATLLSRT